MKENLTIDLKIRFSPSDNEKIQNLCHELGIKRATWIRQTVLKELEKEYKNGTVESSTEQQLYY